jgi:peptide/nickel transport system substrate-binding protein
MFSEEKIHMNKRIIFNILLSVSFILSACTSTAPTATKALEATKAPEATKPPETKHSIYSQAPMLDELVMAGKIPPVEERLPEQPFVVGPGVYLTKENLPDWTPGKYGGTLRSVQNEATWNPDVFVAIDEPFLMAPKIGDQGIICNVCQDYEVSNDNKIFTFTLRKGLKWSDGKPVTTKDVRFAWEEVQNNTTVYPDGPDIIFHTGASPDGSLARFDFLDDYTFTITFDAPYGGFLRALAIEGWVGYTILLEPAHYLKLAKYDLASTRCTYWDMTAPRCAGYPALNPWIPVATNDTNLMRWERDPYYFKVDTAGQQLPYIDAITSQVVDSLEMETQQVVQGEVDLLREDAGLVNLKLYQENEAKAGFRIQLLDMHNDPTGLAIFQTFGGPNWRKLAQDVRFRQAVSLAINRQELIDTIYLGYAALPLQTVGEANSQFDVARANALLDEIGLTQKDAAGYRQYQDGTPLEILLEYSQDAPDIGPAADLTAKYLKTIGLKVTVRVNNAIDWSRTQASIFWSHDKGNADVSSIFFVSPVWTDWIYTKGKQGEEPPQWVKDIVKIDAEKWAAVPGTDAFNQKVAADYQWSRDNLPFITYVESVKYPLIVNKNLKNVPTSGYAISANFSVVQMYFDTP